ncbi:MULTISPECIES: winged helix-turn-helix transcriptional regulator [Natrinema]|uniref:MarR family transcriptional regulator n=2 Tax=Natrinema TaxID=88723 RepID=A0A2A5QXX2_9EURY|nr:MULTISPECIES: ArsR family transcriptional regulator [Natrinema]MBZ6494727.1 MarR family transcriptional regulator [Natrinema longum]PCR91680.1 MarR family transcriptional regulator [Natrinema ejinorense]QSW83962.1 MarR family transcriptional regulator [Natrinema longum]
MTKPDGVDDEKRATLRRFAALGAASPLVGRADAAAADTGESDARDAIAGYLSTTPGAHFSKIRDDLQLGTGETQHHLRRLEELDAIERYRDGDYKRFVTADRFDEFEKRALGYLRRETPRGMLIELLLQSDATAGDLAEALDVSAPTVSKYAGQLEDAGLLSREDGYAVERPETVLVLVVRHADSFGDRAQTLAKDADQFLEYQG